MTMMTTTMMIMSMHDHDHTAADAGADAAAADDDDDDTATTTTTTTTMTTTATIHYTCGVLNVRMGAQVPDVMSVDSCSSHMSFVAVRGYASVVYLHACVCARVRACACVCARALARMRIMGQSVPAKKEDRVALDAKEAADAGFRHPICRVRHDLCGRHQLHPEPLTEHTLASLGVGLPAMTTTRQPYMCVAPICELLYIQ